MNYNVNIIAVQHMYDGAMCGGDRNTINDGRMCQRKKAF